MRWLLLLWFAATVCACGSSNDAGQPGGDSSPTGDSSIDETAIDAGGGDGDGAPVCPTAPKIVVTGKAVPGSTVTLSIAPPFLGSVTWSASKGTIAPAKTSGGTTAKWMIPSDVATHLAETITVTASFDSTDCASPPPLDVVVDWPDPLRTIVVYDSARAGSKDVADAYAAYRSIPPDHLCAVTTADPVSISSSDYAKVVDTVVGCAGKIGPWIHTLVPVWGVPYKVSGQVSDLADATRKVEVCLDELLVFGAASKSITAPTVNPYFQGSDPYGGTDSLQDKYKPYVPFGKLRDKKKADYFMVARIDGADAMAAKQLVDRTKAADALAAAGKLAGKVYVDGNKGLPHPTTDVYGSYEGGEWNIIGVENVFKAYGKYTVVADYNGEEFGTAPAPLTAPDALYYAGWYSFGHYNDVFTWNVGAIGGHLDSCSACDIRGSTDWSAMALRRGITATFGAVNEPYVAGLPEYDQFFLYLTQGASFGEAAYESNTVAAWMTVFVGDPLYRPYPAKK